jgi:hypothetical protein
MLYNTTLPGILPVFFDLTIESLNFGYDEPDLVIMNRTFQLKYHPEIPAGHEN